MRTSSLAAAVTSAMLFATALTPVRAADMTFERAQNVAKEPQNWLLHHGNYQGHRFSALKEINADLEKQIRTLGGKVDALAAPVGESRCRELLLRVLAIYDLTEQLARGAGLS